ncbi:hypothetical protein E4U38_001465 [Claviceps purpurea]|nr:hypothetical protein E4U38_001465 [Claviceps purpurea]
MNNAETASRPDFLPAGELKLVLRQRGHCEQVPPFQSGAHVRLTGLLQSLLDLFNEIEEEPREGFGDLGQRLGALGLKQQELHCMDNRTVVDEYAQLTPFYSVLTGELNCNSQLSFDSERSRGFVGSFAVLKAPNPASVIGAVDPQALEMPAIWSTPISDLDVKTPLL